MSACEKCWSDAYLKARCQSPYDQVYWYNKLLEERKDNPCTPKQQAGQFWDEEKQCDSREICNTTN